MALNTRGFSVDVMPTFQMPDPRLLAWDPSQALQGAQSVMQLANAFEARKGAKAQREALQFQTAQAKDQAPLVMRDLSARVQRGELELAEAQAIQADRIAALKAQFQSQATLTPKETNLRLGQIGAAATLLPGQTENDMLKQVLEGKGIRSGIENFDETEATKRKAAQLQIKEMEAKIKSYEAEAERWLAEARNKDLKVSPSQEAFLKEVGELAGAVGANPEAIFGLIESKKLNKDGIPLSTELMMIARQVTKGDVYIDPTVRMSDELKSELGLGGKLAAHAAKGEPTPGAGAPAVIKVSADGKVTLPTASAPAASAPAPEEAAFTDQGAPAAAAASAQPQGSSALPGIATIGGGGALYALTNPKIQAAIQNAPANLTKAAKNAWVGREAGRFTGQGISNQLSRLGKSPIKLGAGPAALAASLGNEAIPMVLNTRLGEALIGKRGTDRSTDDLTVAEGVAKAITADSFDEMVAQTSYDEAINLIDRIRGSAKISPEKKQEAISALLERIRTIDIGR